MVKTVRTAASAAQSVTSVLERPTQLVEEEIAELAYSFWEARGFQGGAPEDDWLRAERELMMMKEMKRD
jgi:hypothetical protein